MHFKLKLTPQSNYVTGVKSRLRWPIKYQPNVSVDMKKSVGALCEKLV